MAIEAAGKAYCRYSNYKVGAALMVEGTDEIFIGANIENASYPIGICAEMTALAGAVVKGF